MQKTWKIRLCYKLNGVWCALLGQLSPAVHNQRRAFFGSDNRSMGDRPVRDELRDMLVFDTSEGRYGKDIRW